MKLFYHARYPTLSSVDLSSIISSIGLGSRGGGGVASARSGLGRETGGYIGEEKLENEKGIFNLTWELEVPLLPLLGGGMPTLLSSNVK